MKFLLFSLASLLLAAAPSIGAGAAPAATQFKITIRGEVAAPGRYTISSDYSVIDAIELAGGFTARALRTDVEIRRVVMADGESKPTVFRLDYSDFPLNNANASFRLEPGDVIFIPADPSYGK
jgi:protein involved in polysaccharide export with SLBB domain